MLQILLQKLILKKSCYKPNSSIESYCDNNLRAFDPLVK